MIVLRGYGKAEEVLGSIVLYGYGRNPFVKAILIIRDFILRITQKFEVNLER